MHYLEQRAILWLIKSGFLPYEENQIDVVYGNDWQRFGASKNDVIKALQDYLRCKQPIDKLFGVFREYLTLQGFIDLVLKHYNEKILKSNSL